MTLGDFVEHYDWGGFGILIAKSDSELIVLWSKLPDNSTWLGKLTPSLLSPRPRYVPLQITPSIFSSKKMP